MTLFTGTADFYRHYRPGIPQSVADLLDAAVPERAEERRHLDIGSGTGQVIEALHGRFADVVAVDADKEMLSVAENELRNTTLPFTRLTFVHAPAEAFEVPRGWEADLVTICRAFHWFDRPMVLRRLESILAPGGVIAVLSDQSLWTIGNDWTLGVRQVVQHFLGEKRRAGAGTFTPQKRSFLDDFYESEFSVVDEMWLPVERIWDKEKILGYLYSTSFAAPHLFGSRQEEFERLLHQKLDEFSNEDRYVEHNKFHILLARRQASSHL